MKHRWVWAGALLALVCGYSGAHRLREATLRASVSSERDRQLALQTFARLPERAVDYKIGASDVLEVGIFQWELSEETKTLAVRVSQEGIVSLPLIGDLNVKGKTVREVRSEIEHILRAGDFIKEPRVSVVIKEFRSKRIAVVGAVRDPGTYTLRENVTRLLDIVSLAGGIATTAGQHLYVVRTHDVEGAREKQVITVDLHDLLVLGDPALNLVLADGDVVNVPAAQKFFVYGYVQKPGGYDLTRRTTVLDAIAMAGGLVEPMASPGYCVLRRGNQEFEIDLVDVAEGEEPNYYLQPDDILEARQTFLRKVSLLLWDGVRSIVHVGYRLNSP